MPVKLSELDKKFWKELKKSAGIKSSGWLKKADAAVGSKIDALNKARGKFEAVGTSHELLKYIETLEDLSKTFDKFCGKKGLEDLDEADLKKNEKEQLAKEIKAWQGEIDESLAELRKQLKKVQDVLKTKDGDKTLLALDAEKRKQFWEKAGVFGIMDD